ncbi:MAG: 16S rRNA (cytosine(1402)-N(4))-methyltransferase RsmH [Clostridia bacterium]|nr:16S rRNA (cytosine(1402)-N(4))-methyltransferase RsmH [Clostridia bacterium]
MEFKHITVLREQTVEALNIKPDGVYLDCTAGGGGHSALALESITYGRMICIDQDPSAIETLTNRFDGDKRVTIVHDNFVNINEIMTSLGYEENGADGIMADLGVSSHQLDTGERGFSFHKDAPLDMRMSQRGVSAADLVNSLSQQELQRILFTYGDEKFAPQISRNIVKAREQKPIETTFELADIVRDSVPAKFRRDGHPARKTFQALRIQVNGEIDKLETALDYMFERLNVGGRLAIITFHSLEDRVVKNKFKKFCEGCICPPEFPVCVCGRVPKGKIPFKPVTPSKNEIEENSRSRSAKLRVIEKINL